MACIMINLNQSDYKDGNKVVGDGNKARVLNEFFLGVFFVMRICQISADVKLVSAFNLLLLQVLLVLPLLDYSKKVLFLGHGKKLSWYRYLKRGIKMTRLTIGQ